MHFSAAFLRNPCLRSAGEIDSGKNVCFTVTECAGCRSPQAVCGHYIGVRTRLGRCVILFNIRTSLRYFKMLRLRISVMTKIKKI